MNILWVTPEIPIPADNGHRVVYCNRIIGLSSLGHKIYLCAFVENDFEFSYRNALLKYCEDVSLFRRDKSRKGGLRSILLPAHIAKRHSEEFQEKVNRYLYGRNIDVLLVDSINMAQYRPKRIRSQVLTVLAVHNVDHRLMLRSALIQRNLLKKLFLLNEALKTLIYEHHIYENGAFDLFSFVSATERNYIVKKYPRAKTILSPVGVYNNALPFDGQGQDNQSTKTIMFVGNLGYFSNVESITWFVRRVYPRILEHLENVRLYIVGKQPGKDVYGLVRAYRNIEIVGNVPDVIPFLSMADIVIAPMVSGAGVKVKILEALSAKRIVVATRLAVEGTDLLDGKHLLVVDDFDETGFASKCLEILGDKDRFQNIAEKGYNYIIREYSWDKMVRDFNDQLLTALHVKRENL